MSVGGNPGSHRFSYEQQAIDLTGDDGRSVERMVSELDGESPDKGKPSQLGTALLEMVRKLVRPGNARASAQRFIGLCLVLCPDVLGLSQRAAAAQMRLTRASLSKTTLQLAQEWNPWGTRAGENRDSAGEIRQGTEAGYSAGRHASQVVKKKKRKNARPD